jgi:prepilin-type processing-associated H-X9-DG protein
LQLQVGPNAGFFDGHSRSELLALDAFLDELLPLALDAVAEPTGLLLDFVDGIHRQDAARDVSDRDGDEQKIDAPAD